MSEDEQLQGQPAGEPEGDQGQSAPISGGTPAADPAKTAAMSEEEARERVAQFRKSIREEHERELREAGRLKDLEEKKAPAADFDSDFEQFMGEVVGKARAKFPTDAPGISEDERARRLEKQSNYIQKEYTKGVVRAASEHAYRIAEEKIGARLNGLAQNFTELTASTYFGSHPELAEVSGDIRDVIEGRRPVTLDFVQQLISLGEKHGVKKATPQEQPLLTLVRSKRTGRQVELPSDIAHVVAADEKSIDKSIDEMWDKFLPRASGKK